MRKFIHIPETPGGNVPFPNNKTRKLAVWSRMKKIDANIYSKNNAFGVYFGIINKKYCVGVRNLDNDNISMIEAFNTMSELQHCWIID